MPVSITEIDFFRLLLPNVMTVVLRNPVAGAMELRGNDLTVKESEFYITIYHEKAHTSESQSHLHMKKGSFKYAQVVERDGGTPFVAFWPDKNSVSTEKPGLSVTFPSFYDWPNGKKPIINNHEYFRNWVALNGTDFLLFPGELQ